MAVCKYHSDRPAIGQCQACGIFVCSSCSVKREKRLLCHSCANIELSADRKEERKYYKNRGGRFVKGKDFIVPSIFGLLLAFGFIILLLVNNAFYINPSIREAFYLVRNVSIACILIFCIPYGFIFINSLLPDIYMNFAIRAILFIIKLIFSFIVGWLAFIVYLIKFFIGRKKNKKKSSE